MTPKSLHYLAFYYWELEESKKNFPFKNASMFFPYVVACCHKHQMPQVPFKPLPSLSRLFPFVPLHLPIKIPLGSSTIPFLCKPSSLSIMAGKTQFVCAEIEDPNSSKIPNFPTPLSPPLPQISKDIELRRAMTASSKSSLFSLSWSDILFEDEFLIVVNKPSGIYCESVLASIPPLINTCSKSTEKGNTVMQPSELHLANRLDRDTSGVMVITKSHKVAGKLVKAFTDHKVKKTYIAMCIGVTPEWEKITIKSGHGRSKFGVWRVYSASDQGRSLPGGSTVKDMVSSFEVLSINRQGYFKEPMKFITDDIESLIVEDRVLTRSEACDEKDEILVRAYPRSGRTHQIRLHCQYLGIPILGDVKYEGVHEWRGTSYETHALHAESLSLDHPVTGAPIELSAPLPVWAIEAFRRD